MASIYKIPGKSFKGRKWLVRLRRLGFPFFSKTFTNIKDAKKWISENEDNFFANPLNYLKPERIEKLNKKDHHGCFKT